MRAFLGNIVGALLLSVAVTQGAVNIFVVGSEATRASSSSAIRNTFTGSSTFAGVGSSDSAKANFGVFSGSWSGTTVNVFVSYIGDFSAIKSVAGAQTVKFVSGTNAGSNSGSVPDPTVSGNPAQSMVPDFATTVNFQNTTPYVGTYQGTTYANLTDQKVAVIPLKWLGSKNFPGDNITTQQAQLILTTGVLPLALFTAVASDETKLVYSTGGNVESGQRYAALLESEIPANSWIVNFKPVISGASPGVGGFVTSGTVVSHDMWPSELVNGAWTDPGSNGAPSGAVLASYLTAVLSSNAATYNNNFPGTTAAYYVSYLALGDADAIAIPNGAVELKWNGVAYSVQGAREGDYTFWVYQHVLYPAAFSGVKKTYADSLANRLKAVDGAVGGILLNADFRNSRSTDGGFVTPSYF